MLDPMSALVSSVLLALALPLIQIYRHLRTLQSLPYPPGPPGRLVIGNVLDIPNTQRYRVFASWAKQYDNAVVSFQVPGFCTVVLNSLEATKDIFEKRSGIYSDRPQIEMITLMGQNFAVPAMRYSKEWRINRSMVIQPFRPKIVPLYHPVLRSSVTAMLKVVLDRPGSVVDEVKRYAGTLPIKIVYGRDMDGKTDHHFKIGEEVAAMGGSVVFPGAIMVTMFPFLKHFPKWLPGIRGFKTFAEKSRKMCHELINDLYDDVKRDMEAGVSNTSLAADFIRRINAKEEEERDERSSIYLDEQRIKEVMTTIHLAAADTSEASISVAILTLLLHPDVQARAKVEIDAVVGRERLPDFGDRASPGDRVYSLANQHNKDETIGDDRSDNAKLVYVEAVCRELLRWIVVLPLGVPHAAFKDDVYEGMFIPKGAIIVGNAWAILHDPVRYPNPEEFRPERFITEDGRLNDDIVLPAFGFGRRSCPGRHLANSTIWLAVVSMLSVFDIVKAKDENGDEIDVAVEMEESTICHPKPFKCEARVRDNRAAALIRSLGSDK
ncbi:cytochrome P450 [Stereum hirsutum FP-91666 SS1]|uniref:Cytochrome P450 n=1 Tax=Stereum hirsutum (strain FP-91666) TaxID=721885 RepID=R7RW35_STEHR|nr:cytochrome P450 [Stereum hirsutum FP-91666 SS1]EIM79474.1 cytochrome P450 [Stereum hirsutum FP-91666 SS1]